MCLHYTWYTNFKIFIEEKSPQNKQEIFEGK